jgi:hypothetical protein
MVRRFLRIVKINVRRRQGKLIVFIAGISSSYGGKRRLAFNSLCVEKGAVSNWQLAQLKPARIFSG